MNWKKLAEKMKYEAIWRKKIVHSIFDIVSTGKHENSFYKNPSKRFEKKKKTFRWNFEALNKNIICKNVLPVGKGSWIKKLTEKEIILIFKLIRLKWSNWKPV